MLFIKIRSKIKIGIDFQQRCQRLFSIDSYPQFRKTKNSRIDGKNNILNELRTMVSSEDWRKAANFITDERFHCTRNSLFIFNNLTAKAFLEADQSLGWEMLAKINASQFQPDCNSFLAYWDFCTLDKNTFPENIEKMFEFISKNDILLSKMAIEELSLRIKDFGGLAEPTNIRNEGVCDKCQYQMQRMQQSALEFHALKREFEKVLIKPNISTVELSVFRQLVNKKKTFDFIIDALNVTRTFPESKGNIFKQGKVLAKFVENLKTQNKKVFVVGKKHVESWPEQSINFVRKNATVYLTNHNAAVDDILMMYAALISGPNSHFVTNDLLEEYPKEFSDDGKKLFKNWQKQHQHFVSYDNQTDSIEIHKPKRFICSANKDPEQQHWHIPFTEKPLLNSLRGLVRIPIIWYCIKLKKNK